MTRNRPVLALLTLGLVLTAAACGADDADSAAPDPTTTVPVVVPAVTDAPTTSHPTEHTVNTEPATTEPATTEPATTEPATTVPVVEPGPLSVTTREYEFVGLPAVMRAGDYSITVQNDGMEPHELVIFQPTTGKTLDELEAIGPAGFVDHALIGAFVAPFGPGTTAATVDVTLAPGEWTVACFIPAVGDGEGHFHHGMTQTITVVP